MQTFRTFVAVPLPPNTRKTLGRLIEDHASEGDGVKWVPPEILHLTLKFLGEVDNVEASAVCNVARRSVDDIDPFDIRLTSLTALPTPTRPRSLVVAVQDDQDRLRTIAGRMEDGYAEMGFRRENRDYVPHITLGRTRGSSRRISGEVASRWCDDECELDADLRVDRIDVVASFLDKKGPTYNLLESIDL